MFVYIKHGAQYHDTPTSLCFSKSDVIHIADLPDGVSRLIGLASDLVDKNDLDSYPTAFSRKMEQFNGVFNKNHAALRIMSDFERRCNEAKKSTKDN